MPSSAANRRGILVCPCPYVCECVLILCSLYLMTGSLYVDQTCTTYTAYKVLYLTKFSRLGVKVKESQGVLWSKMLLNACLHSIWWFGEWILTKPVPQIIHNELYVWRNCKGKGSKVRATRWHSSGWYKIVCSRRKRFTYTFSLILFSASLLLHFYWGFHLILYFFLWIIYCLI